MNGYEHDSIEELMRKLRRETDPVKAQKIRDEIGSREHERREQRDTGTLPLFKMSKEKKRE